MMHVATLSSSSVFINACEKIKQNLAGAILTIGEIIHDDEVFQKICLIALAIIRGINYQCRTNYLPNLMSILDTACALDFFGFCRLPRLFLYPYTPSTINEIDLLDQLEPILCSNWGIGTPDAFGKKRESSVRIFAQDQLNAFLIKMSDKNMDFRNGDEVKIILLNWFRETLKIQPVPIFDPTLLNFRLLNIQLKKQSLVESLVNYLFITVDILCIPSFFQAWDLINLNGVAKQIGRIPLLSNVLYLSLDDWVWKLLGIANFLNAVLCLRDLYSGNLSLEEARGSKWLLIASIGESVYSVAMIRSTNGPLINALALFAKSAGLISFLMAPKPTFFKDIQ